MSGAGRSALRFGKFSLVGLLGAILQVLLLWLLTRYLHVRAVAAAPLAVELVLLHNFFWHERFTWRDRKPPGLRSTFTRLWRFHAANGLVSLVGNTVLVHVFAGLFRAPLLSSAIATIALCSLANFWLADRWAYSTNSSLSP